MTIPDEDGPLFRTPTTNGDGDGDGYGYGYAGRGKLSIILGQFAYSHSLSSLYHIHINLLLSPPFRFVPFVIKTLPFLSLYVLHLNATYNTRTHTQNNNGRLVLTTRPSRTANYYCIPRHRGGGGGR